MNTFMVNVDDKTARDAGRGQASPDSPLLKFISPDNPLLKFIKSVLPGGGMSKTARADLVAKNSETFPLETQPSATGPLMTVVVRNEFYRDGFRNMMRIAIAEAIIIVVLVLTFIVYMNATQPQNRYFATTADGRIMQLVPLDLPNLGTSALLSWTAQSASEIMTFGFHDYQRRMQQSSRHFTRHGWETFTAALQKSRIIESVETAKQVVSAQPRSAPVLIQEGVFNGKYRWVVELPLTVNYLSGSAVRADNLMVRLVIDRVPSLENPNGVGIEQWIATQ